MTNHPTVVRLKKISTLMDSQFVAPLGFRFGLDGIIGLVPVLGDLIGIAVTFYIIYESAQLGCSPSVLARMGLNLLVETVVESIPVLGNVFDFIWRANDKNIALLEDHTLDPRGATVKARLVLGAIAFTCLALFIGTVALTINFIQFLYNWIFP